MDTDESACGSCQQTKSLDAEIDRLRRRVAELTVMVEEAWRAAGRPAARPARGLRRGSPQNP